MSVEIAICLLCILLALGAWAEVLAMRKKHKEKLTNMDKMRSGFVADVSHELRTPITSIQGSLEMLRETPLGADGEAATHIEVALRQADRLNSIVGDLLALAQIERSEEAHDLEFVNVPVQDLFESAVSQVRQSDRKGMVFSVEAEPRLEVKCNASLREQCILNLLTNAVRYSEPGKTIRLRGARQGKWVYLSVADQGIGIEARHIPHLFQRFYRADKARSRKEGGTGLGLAIVKHIAQLHGGTVKVESVPGRGSVFTVIV
jgi:two-component system phosphate regulon sensor histidine kinase PhoR